MVDVWGCKDPVVDVEATEVAEEIVLRGTGAAAALPVRVEAAATLTADPGRGSTLNAAIAAGRAVVRGGREVAASATAPPTERALGAPCNGTARTVPPPRCDIIAASDRAAAGLAKVVRAVTPTLVAAEVAARLVCPPVLCNPH